jgi:hypothetical protein
MSIGIKHGWEIGERAAWHRYGHEHPFMFAFGKHVAKGVGFLALAGMIFGAGVYVWHHAAAWMGWLGGWTAVHVLPALGVSALVILYAVIVSMVWHLNGYRWKYRGVSTRAYTVSCVSLLMLVALTVGVAA